MTNDAVLQELEALTADMSYEEKTEFAEKLYAMGLAKIANGEGVSRENIRTMNQMRTAIKRRAES